MDIRPLSIVLQEKAEKELNEDPLRLESDILSIKEWLNKQTHLESVNPTDQWLLSFLRGSKFSIERCKEKFDVYYTLRTNVPELFSLRDPFDEKIQEILKAGVFLPLLGNSTEDSSRIVLVRYGAGSGSQFLLTDLIKVSLMIVEILMLEDDNFIVAGEIAMVDMKNMGIGLLSQWTPALAKKVIQCFEEALPVRLKGIHILNTLSGFETAFNIFKAFIGKKLKERVFVYGKESEEIHKNISKSVLPIEYGGKEQELNDLIDHWKNKVESYQNWFLQEETVRADENRRSSAQDNSSRLFGVVGSFRRLGVD